jgi:hypothetical protein
MKRPFKFCAGHSRAITMDRAKFPTVLSFAQPSNIIRVTNFCDKANRHWFDIASGCSDPNDCPGCKKIDMDGAHQRQVL